MEARDSFCFPKKTKNPNPSPIEKRFGFSILAAGFPVDIPTGWEPQRNLAVRALRVAFADFSAAPWQGFEKSERGPNNSSLFQPLAAVVVVAVQVLLSAVTAKEKLPCKTKKTAIKSCLPCGAGMQSKSEPFPFDVASATFSNVMVCVPSL